MAHSFVNRTPWRRRQYYAAPCSGCADNPRRAPRFATRHWRAVCSSANGFAADWWTFGFTFTKAVQPFQSRAMLAWRGIEPSQHDIAHIHDVLARHGEGSQPKLTASGRQVESAQFHRLE